MHTWMIDGALQCYCCNTIPIEMIAWGGFGEENLGECWFDTSNRDLSTSLEESKMMIEERLSK